LICVQVINENNSLTQVSSVFKIQLFTFPVAMINSFNINSPTCRQYDIT